MAHLKAHLKLVSSNRTENIQPLSNRRSASQDIEYPSVGAQYNLLGHGVIDNFQSDIVKDYRLSIKQSEIVPLEINAKNHQGYFWHANFSEEELSRLDIDFQCKGIGSSYRLIANRAMMQSSRLIGPDLVNISGKTALVATPEFIIHLHTAAGDAQLGEIRLVDSSRFLTLKNGKTIPLMCTDPAEGQALLLDSQQDHPVLAQDFIQPKGSNESYVVRRTLKQFLPDDFRGEEVECITVLEHVTSYFMQKLTAEKNSIWTPLMQPISWGWNIKAQKDDDQWHILKKKIMTPTNHHEGLKLPEWRTHIREHTATEWQTLTSKPAQRCKLAETP